MGAGVATGDQMILNQAFRICVAALFIVMAGWVTYLVAERSWPTETTERVLETPIVKIGEELRISSQVTTWKRCRTHTDRIVIDSAGVRHNLPPIDRESGASEIGKQETVVTAIRMSPESFTPSSNLALGPTIYRVIPTAWCNWTNSYQPIYGEVRDTTFTLVQ